MLAKAEALAWVLLLAFVLRIRLQRHAVVARGLRRKDRAVAIHPSLLRHCGAMASRFGRRGTAQPVTEVERRLALRVHGKALRVERGLLQVVLEELFVRLCVVAAPGPAQSEEEKLA